MTVLCHPQMQMGWQILLICGTFAGVSDDRTSGDFITSQVRTAQAHACIERDDAVTVVHGEPCAEHFILSAIDYTAIGDCIYLCTGLRGKINRIMQLP